MPTWSCDCGLVEAEVPAEGARIVCYCESCRAFVTRLDHADRLDGQGGNDLLQVAPDKVVFRKGAEHLRWMRITEKGPLRWYASCCNTPMANTLGTPGLPFASFQAWDIEPKAALPPIGFRVNLKGATGHVPEPHGNPLWLILGLLRRAGGARLSGRWKTNPFFGADGKPVAARLDP